MKEGLIYTKDSRMMSFVEPVDGGFWVSLGTVGHSGIFIDSEEWDSFCELVDKTNDYVKENYS